MHAAQPTACEQILLGLRNVQLSPIGQRLSLLDSPSGEVKIAVPASTPPKTEWCANRVLHTDCLATPPSHFWLVGQEPTWQTSSCIATQL